MSSVLFFIIADIHAHITLYLRWTLFLYTYLTELTLIPLPAIPEKQMQYMNKT